MVTDEHWNLWDDTCRKSQIILYTNYKKMFKKSEVRMYSFDW